MSNSFGNLPTKATFAETSESKYASGLCALGVLGLRRIMKLTWDKAPNPNFMGISIGLILLAVIVVVALLTKH